MLLKPQSKLIIIAFCLSVSEVLLADWSADFKPPTEQQQTLLISLPNDLDISVLTTLMVELDGIDITSLISFDNQDFLYTPVEPLTNGEHIVRLMLLKPDGSLTEKGKWQFDVLAERPDLDAKQEKMANAEAWLTSASFKADTLTEYSNRIKQHNIGSAPDHSIISGAGNIEGDLQGENWSINARSNYLIQSDKDLALTGNTADIGEYIISANYAGNSINTGLRLGHHSIASDSILFSSIQRRGISAEIADKSDRISTNVFAFRPEPQVGAQNFTGLSDNINRLDGISGSLKPFSNDKDAMKITGLYYDGEGSTGGVGISGEEGVAKGSGYSLILEKNLLEGKIDIRGEYARATYDADGNTGLAPEDKSNAISLRIEARPFENPILFDKQMDIVFGTQYERIDTFFDSLANQGMASDRDATTVYNNIYWGSFSANLQFAYQTNNVDDLAAIPTDRQRTFMWNSNYSFDSQTGRSAWLGTPYLSFSGLTSKLDRKSTPIGYQGSDTDSISQSITLGGGSSYQDWYWSASHTYALLEDDANTTSDTSSSYSSLNMGWTVSERLELNGDMQYGIFEDKDNQNTSYNTNMNFGLRSILIRDKLNLNFNYNLNLASGSDDSPDKHVINSELGWTIRQARRNHPGLALTFRGSMETNHANTNNTTEETEYQIFVIFQVMAPLSSER